MISTRQAVFGSVVVIAFILLAGVSFAGCAADAYRKACSSCPFDANGTMNQTCYQGYQASGIACLSTTYPIMSAKYAEGNCSEVDTCSSELQACKAKESSGNDSFDCENVLVEGCMLEADKCMLASANSCGENVKLCPSSSFILLFLGVGIVASSKR